MEEHSNLVNTIFIGEVASVQEYGAFVRIPGISKQGLVHRSQVSSAPVDDVSEVLSRGDKVYCKVISVRDGKIGLSMKHVNQGNGKDLDPNGVQLQQDEQQRKVFVPNSRKKIELEAVLNTTCSKCGTRGHMSRDCFKSPDGKIYDLLPEDDVVEESLPLEKQQESVTQAPGKKVKKEKKEKKSSLHKDKKKRKLKKSKKHKTSRDYTIKDASRSEIEGKIKKKGRKRSHSSSSSDTSTHKERKRHSYYKDKKV